MSHSKQPELNSLLTPPGTPPCSGEHPALPIPRVPGLGIQHRLPDSQLPILMLLGQEKAKHGPNPINFHIHHVPKPLVLLVFTFYFRIIAGESQFSSCLSDNLHSLFVSCRVSLYIFTFN